MIFGSLFGRKPTASPPSAPAASIMPIAVASEADERAYLNAVACECAGAWLTGERTLIDRRADAEIFRRDVQCQICGLPGSFVFTSPAGAYEEDEEVLEPRDHHYIFVHRILPQLFFGDPEGFLAVFLSSIGTRRLGDLWQSVGENEASDGMISAAGLDIEPVTIGGRAGALIRLPEALVPPEGYFAALLEPSENDEPRFFLLERTDLDGPPGEAEERGVLCEWLEGGRRRNHSRIVPPDAARFVDEIEAEMEHERQRRAGGARQIGSWDLAGKDDVEELMFAEDFRLQPCFFAFHLLPEALLRDRAVVDGATHSEIAALTDRLWETAGRLCALTGEPPLPTDVRPTSAVRQVHGEPFLVVEMPPAFDAPEPIYLAARLTRAARLYLIERSRSQPVHVFVTSIDAEGSHAIIGSNDDCNLNSFLASLGHEEGIPQPQNLSPKGTLAQLVKYSAIAKRIEDVT